MDVAVVERSDQPRWDAFVMGHPHTIAWHLYGFSDILKRHYQVEFLPLAAISDSEITGILPLYRVKTSFSSEMLISVPYFVAGGIVADDEETRLQLLAAAVGIARERGIRTVTLKQYKHKMPGELTTDTNYYNRELDLTMSLDAIHDQFAPANRQMIEQTDKVPHEMEFPSNDVDAFYRLLLHHHHARGVPGIGRRFLDDIYGSGMYPIALIRHEGKVVAGTMAKAYRDTVSFPHSCSLDGPDTSMQFMFALYWRLIRTYQADGYAIFHSGRIPFTDDVDSYRLGWGGVRHQYYYQYYPATVGATEYSKKRNWKRDLFKVAWKTAPEWLNDKLGPFVYKQFP